MSVIVDRLLHLGGKVSTDELLYQLARKDGLSLSRDEVHNQLRHEELAGRVESYTYFKALEAAPAEEARRAGVNVPERGPVPASPSAASPRASSNGRARPHLSTRNGFKRGGQA